MAAPASVTIKNFDGKYTMNKSLSGDTDAMLALQGMSWLTRKALGLANVTLYITTHDEAGVHHIDVRQVATAGIEASPENRVFDWEERHQDDKVFGKVSGRTRWTTPADLDVADAEDKKFLSQGWDEEGEKVEARTVNEANGWNVISIWGFTVINGQRYHTRKMVLKNNKGKTIRDKLVYDYLGTAQD